MSREQIGRVPTRTRRVSRALDSSSNPEDGGEQYQGPSSRSVGFASVALPQDDSLFCCGHAAPCTESYRYAETIRHAGQQRSSVLHLPVLPKHPESCGRGKKHGTEN